MALTTKPRKRARVEGGSFRTPEEIKILGQQLLSSRAYVNNAPILLSFLTPSSRIELALESLISLQSFFIPLLPDIPPSSKPHLSSDNKDPEFVFLLWLRSKFDQFIDFLIKLLVSPQSQDALKDVALDAIMEFVKLGKEGQFQLHIYHKLIVEIIHSQGSEDFLLDLLASNFFKYSDIRYFTYVSLEKLATSFGRRHANGNGHAKSIDGSNPFPESSKEDLAIHKMYGILSRVPALAANEGVHDNEVWCASAFLSRKEDKDLPSNVVIEEDGLHMSKDCSGDALLKSRITKRLKIKFTKAWISFLKLSLPVDLYKEVLVNLHQKVIPHISKPVILCDFLTRSYDIGGVISTIALSSLFVLMTQYGVEYPSFYEKLYALLEPCIFMAKHRARFFQLLDTCLKSSLLPAYLAAAFAKKLSRLSLSAPASGALVIIAIIHNLLRRHPSINCLVHQEDNEIGKEASKEECALGNGSADVVPETSDRKTGADPFNSEEKNPAKSNALRSSLWEIESLRHHYCPAVSRFVSSLEEDLTVRSKTSEVAIQDFSSASYATIFGEEIRRRVKQVPLAFYKATPTLLFSESEFPGWTFGSRESSGEDNGNDSWKSAPQVSTSAEVQVSKKQRTESP